MADERALAVALTDWLDATRPPDGPSDAGIFPRLLAAVAHTALRVAIEHWCERPGEVVLADAFQDAFAQLAQGLPRPPA